MFFNISTINYISPQTDVTSALHTEPVEYSPVFDLKDVVDSDGCRIKSSDVALILRRNNILKELPQNIVNQWVSNLSKGSQFDTSGFTDEQLSSFIRSRYCTTMGDVQNYNKWLDEHLNEIQDDLRLMRNKYASKPKDDINNNSKK